MRSPVHPTEAALRDHLETLLHPERTVITLEIAARLIEDAADNLADHSPGQDVVQLLLLSAKMNAVAERHEISNKH